MSDKSLLILNRKSAARPDIRDAVKTVQQDAKLDVVIPWSGKQLRKTVAKAVRKGTTRIIAGGGDGTLNKVTGAVLACDAGPEVAMGLVPLGTANDFARSYGDDGSDLTASLRRAITAPCRPIDVGTINGAPFVNVASAGFGAMITATTPKEVKRRLGGLAYTLTGLARLSELVPTRGTITLDGGEPVSGAILALIVGNNRYAGGGFDVAPDADLTDGALDLAILTSDVAFPGAQKIAKPPKLADLKDELIWRRRFHDAVLDTETPLHLNLDGEPMVDTRFEISVLPGRLNFALPETV